MLGGDIGDVARWQPMLGALEAQQSTGCCSIFAESYTGGEGTVDWIFRGVLLI